jgi:hypothetical protein
LQPRIKAGLGGLNVFFYPHKQEDLIGSNGLESMRAPFLGARVSVHADPAAAGRKRRPHHIGQRQ